MSEEWGVKTGTLYFHLKELDSLLTQNEQKHYILTDEGREVASWFVEDPDGKSTVAKINVYTGKFYGFLQRISHSSIYQGVILFIGLSVILTSYKVDAIVIGSVILPSPSRPVLEIVLINFGSIVLLLGIMSLLIILLGDLEGFKFDHTGIFLLASNIITYLLLLILTAISLRFSISIELTLWVIISILSQIFQFLFITSALISQFNLSVERSLLISSLVLYSSMSLGMLLL